MKKIVFVIDSLTSGGAERVMTVLASNLSVYRYDITIISKSHNPPFYQLNNNAKLIYPNMEINYKNMFTTLFTRLRLYLEIYNYLKKVKPYLVIPFSTTTNGLVIIICRILKLSVIACEHNNYKVGIRTLPNWFIKRHIYPHATLLTVLTERDKNEYYSKFMKNVIVMLNPLSIEPAQTVNTIQRDKTILAIGNVSRWKQKGFDNLLIIFSKIQLKHPGWKLIIAGGGDSGYLNEIILKLRLTEKVLLVGAVKEIKSLMMHNSIFAMTSRWEGLPMVLLEAMSQGMASIAFDCFTGPGDVITNAWDGILVEDQNIDQFVYKLSELIENQNMITSLGTNAIETSKKYLPEKIVKKWHQIIECPTIIYE